MRLGETEQAARLLSAGIRMWPGIDDPGDEESRFDKARMLTYRGLLHEMDGDVQQAIELYEEVLEMFPFRRGIEHRVRELKDKGHATSRPFDVLKMTMFRHVVCEHD